MGQHTNVLYITRFFAAVAIVVGHFAPRMFWDSYYDVFKNSAEAVNYFFFLSGFVMVVSNKKFIHAGNKNIFPVRGYWIKRFARIYPLYLFCLLLVVAFHYLVAYTESYMLIKLPLELFVVQRWVYMGSVNFPAWSISCEMLFYLMFPLLIAYISKSRVRYVYITLLFFVAAICCNCLLLTLKQANQNPLVNRVLEASYQHPFLKLPVFMLGTVCGIAYENNWFRFFTSGFNRIVCTLLCLAIIFFTLYLLPKNHVLIDSGSLSVVYFFFLLGICNFQGKAAALFEQKWMIFLGDISYGIYILQYPVFLFYKHFIAGIETNVQLLAFIITLIVVATITFYLIEIPFKKLILVYGHKIKTRAAMSNA